MRLKVLIMTLIICVMSILTVGCGKSSTSDGETVTDDSADSEASSWDIVMITDYGTIKDGSYNQGAWEGLCRYADETGASVKYLEPKSADKAGFLEEIKNGVKNGATVVLCPGYLFEETVYEAQSKYSNVNFIILDGKPHNEDFSEEQIGNNTESICFAEEQAGFLAGYSAVRDGYTHLGFMGGIPEDSVIRYGYGFVQGADYAAIEMGVKINIRYVYMNTFTDEPIVESTANAWYQDDTQIIFACGGALGKGVIRSAEINDGRVIGVDIDQSSESEKVVTSAMKSLGDAVYQSLISYNTGFFNGGGYIKYDAKSNGVCLPMDTSRFERFSQDDYDSILSRLIDESIVPYNGVDIGTTQELTLINTTVTYIVL